MVEPTPGGLERKPPKGVLTPGGRTGQPNSVTGWVSFNLTAPLWLPGRNCNAAAHVSSLPVSE